MSGAISGTGFPGFSGPRLSLAAATASGALDKAKPRTSSGKELDAPVTYAATPSPVKGYIEAVKAEARQGPKDANQKMVEATGGTTLPPPRPPDTPAMAAFRAKHENVWAPVEPPGPPPETYGPKPKMGPAAMPAAPKALGVDLPKYA